MFFWGGYSFQIPQSVEKDDQPPLRFPMYVPPCTSILNDAACLKSNRLVEPSETTSSQPTLQRIRDHRLSISLAACGMKHAVLVLGDGPASASRVSPPRQGDKAARLETSHVRHDFSSSKAAAVYGLGSNHSGQLGHHVATYTTSLVNLRLEEVTEGAIVSVACGDRHTLVCTSSGCVYATGDNSCAQLGLPAHIGDKIRPGFNNGAPCVTRFTQIPGLSRIEKVYASHNASFAINTEGQLYSWGSTQAGHLGHNDKGERLDTHTLKVVIENITTPRLVRWFEQHRVVLIEAAVGRRHLVCRSAEDVYTCGEGFFGKLGHGDVLPRLQPTRVEFPPRKQPERLISIAAGDDHTLVLKSNSSIGSVVYFFGKLTNGDGQLRPLIVPIPTVAPLSRVFSSRGNQCIALSTEGVVYVWGKHNYLKVHNGTNASAARARPFPVEVLLPYKLIGVASGGTFMLAFASEKRSLDWNEETKLMGLPKSQDDRWDVVVPQDARIGVKQTGDSEEVYEQGVRRFLQQYLGDELGAGYAAGIPAAPSRTSTTNYQFKHIGSHGLRVGQKVRLWMTDVYAIGTVLKIENPPLKPETDCDNRTARWAQSESDFTQVKQELDVDAKNHHNDTCNNEFQDAIMQTQKNEPCRICITWQRDDWTDEIITLYSNDETLDERNPNRWQPYWFEQNERGEYNMLKSR